jgi:glycosyltransferase involved in cell wall biosynthesis
MEQPHDRARPGFLSSPSRILLVSGSRIIGGAERVSLQIATGLIERGHSVEALCPGTGQWFGALSAAGIGIHPAAIGGALNLLTPFIIATTVSRVRPGLLMVTSSDEWVWSCLTPRGSIGPRLVLVRHMGLPLALRVRWLAGRRADAIVAVSRSVGDSLLVDSAIAAAQVHVIPNAVRFAIRPRVPGQEDRNKARSSLGLPVAGRWIGFLGGINRGKGIEDVMVAARRAHQSLGDVRLLICGRNDPRRDTPGCDDLARKHGLAGRVHYIGNIDDVRPAIVAADVVAIATNSSLREGLSQTAIDAMACGTPIAAYALGGIIDAVGESDPAAVLARPDDIEQLTGALIRILEAPGLATRIAQNGLARANQSFDPSRMLDRYEQLFATLLSNRSAECHNAGTDHEANRGAF